MYFNVKNNDFKVSLDFLKLDSGKKNPRVFDGTLSTLAAL